MNVQQSINLGNGHSIEIGVASWCTHDEYQISIRNRYSTRNGRFNLRASSELALEDLRTLIRTMADFDLLDKGSCADLIGVLAHSIQRQCANHLRMGDSEQKQALPNSALD